MPHLDANALTDDPQGMAFLAKVVGAPCEAATPVARIDGPDIAIDISVERPLGIEASPSKRRRRKLSALVPEAA